MANLINRSQQRVHTRNIAPDRFYSAVINPHAVRQIKHDLNQATRSIHLIRTDLSSAVRTSVEMKNTLVRANKARVGRVMSTVA